MKDDVNNRHIKEYGVPPAVCARVPGVTSLFGSFTDRVKGYSVCFANNLNLYMSVSLRDDSNVCLSNLVSADHKKFSLSSLKYRREDRWANYVKGVICVLNSTKKIPCGLNIVLSGDLLAGDFGMCAEAAGVATALCLDSLFSLNLDRSRIIAVAAESVAQFCNEQLRYMDLFTMLEGREDSLLFFDRQKLSYKLVPFTNLFGNCSFFEVESRVPGAAMREELSDMYRCMENAFTILEKRSCYPNLRDIPENEISNSIIPLPEYARQICSFVLEENNCTREAQRLLLTDDCAALGKLMTRVQKGVRDKLNISCPEVDWLVKRAVETPGCAGACMVRSGLAGSVVILCPLNTFEQFTGKLPEYEHIFGFGARCSGTIPRKAACIL